MAAEIRRVIEESIEGYSSVGVPGDVSQPDSKEFGDEDKRYYGEWPSVIEQEKEPEVPMSDWERGYECGMAEAVEGNEDLKAFGT